MPEKPPAKFSGEYFKPREYSKSENYGRNVHVRVAIERHGDPFKNAAGTSENALTPEGIKKEQEKGKTLAVPKGGIKAYTSPQRRAEQSIGEQLAGLTEARRGARVINLPFNKLKKGLDQVYSAKQKVNPIQLNEALEEYKKAHPNASEDELAKKKAELAERMKEAVSPIIIREALDLNALNEKLFKDILATLADVKDPSEKYNKLVQAYLDRTTDFGETLPPNDAAALLAHRVATELGMASRLKNGSDVMMKNITHGPMPDALLREIIILKKGAKAGFKDVSEVGGATKTMEGYEFDVSLDAKGVMTVKLIHRGKQYDIDLDRLKELAKRGEEILSAMKEKKVPAPTVKK